MLEPAEGVRSTEPNHYLNYWLLLAIILLEGFVTISVEILTIRQLIPVAGSNVIVTSLIIGVFLLFLAYGYRKGGSYKNNYQKILKRNFILAMIMVGVGLSLIFIENFFRYCKLLLDLPPLWILLVYLLLIIAPIVYILGQTVPITTNLFKQDKHIGAISGKVLHLSTVGSFLGSVLTTLVLMNFFGVAWTVLFNVAALAALVLFVERTTITILITVFSGIIAYSINIMFEKQICIATTPYGNYTILNNAKYDEHHIGKILIINDSLSSFINSNKQGFNYIEYLKEILFNDLKLKHKKILVIGAGGFTLSAEKTNDNHFTYVDIDEKLYTKIAPQFVGTVNGKFIAADGRQYVQNTQQKYDVILSDAYSNQQTIPAHMLTYQHMVNIRHALTFDGIAIFNIIARPLQQDNYAKRIDNTIKAVFPNCMVVPLKYSARPVNILYICKKSAQEQDKLIYQDDKNTSMLDAFNG